MPRAPLIGLAVAVVLIVGAVLWWSDGPSEDAGEQPVPAAAVLLIPGYGGDPSSLARLQETLTGAGYTSVVLDIGTGTEDLRGYASEAVAKASELLDAGAPEVSSIGFSAGGLIGRIAAVAEPDLFDEVISLSSPHDGTAWALLGGSGCPPACQQMQPGSDLLESLPAAPDAARWLAIYSQTDEIILPPVSSALVGATVLPIQDVCPSATVRHSGVPAHPLVIAAVVAALADEPLPTACPL